MILFEVGARVFLLLGVFVSAGLVMPLQDAPSQDAPSQDAPSQGTGLQVRVTPVVGEPYAAELQGFSDGSVMLVVDGRPRDVPTAEISRMERTEAAAESGPAIGVALSDGSRLKSEGIAIDGAEATIRLRRQDDLKVAVKQLRWIRFRPPSPAVDDDWLGLIGDQQANDILVIRRSSDTIDRVAGIVLGADESTVRFSVGEQEVPAPIAKLEGIIFGSSEQTGENAISVVDTLGSEWAVASLEMVESSSRGSTSLGMELSSGERRALPLEQIESIRFEGNTQLLAQESPVESQYSPLIELPVDATRLTRWLGPQAAGDRDLVLRSRSSVTYRVAPNFDSFASRIIPDPSVAAGGGCDVRILVDGKVVWSETVLPADKPRGVELKLDEAERITLEVDYGEGEARSDAGDVIRFLEPRLLQ